MNLFRIARLVQDVKSLRSTKSAARRAKNKVVGRALARGGFWRWLWGGR